MPAVVLTGARNGDPTLQGEIEQTAQSTAIPELRDAVSLGALTGKPITRIEVLTVGGRWASPLRIVTVRPGEPVSLEASRRAMRELLATGRFARASVEAAPDGAGALLRVSVVPRKMIATIQVSGGVLDTTETLEAAGVTGGGEVTALVLPQITAEIQTFYARHGFPSASVNVDTSDTDDPTKVVLVIRIQPGAPRTIARRIFVIDPRADREVGDLKLRYALGAGARVDATALVDADRDLTDALRQNGFHRAEVNHAMRQVGPQSHLYVYITPGPRIVPAFDGNRAFDDDQLTAALELGTTTDTKPDALIDRLTSFYVTRGFHDVEITAAERGRADEPVHYLVFTIREEEQMRVMRRVFPCLPPDIDPNKVGQEIESFLQEELPGGEPFSTGNPDAILSLFGPKQFAGSRGHPLDLRPSMTYAPETYDRALKHLRDLYHSQGYLNAVVGPVSIVRATCGRMSTARECIPEPSKDRVAARCLKDALGLPIPEPLLPESLTCRPDPAKNIRCSPEATLRIPIHLGPQTVLYDLAFEGNRTFTDKRLEEIAELRLGQPLSNVDLETARLHILDQYRDLGYAYADVRTAIEPSPDRTRARARFIVTERDLVLVREVVVRGNVYTEKPLILGRLALRANAPYRQDWVRASEERIASLGTFASVSVALEDPDIPQKDKRIIVTVVENLPQYLDPRIGFSTGEGLRFAFEYGHKNIAGKAISLTLRVQLSYLFDFIILDPAVLANLNKLPGSNRLERRNTASITFPEVGLGPLVSLSVEGIDARDNQRDFGLTKEAFIPTITYRPRRSITTQFGASGELNDVQIFKCEQSIDVNCTTKILARLGVPEGRTFALAQRANIVWDGRNNPFSATKGALITAGVEHVNAFKSEVTGNPAEDIDSHFLRLTGRVAGYIPLSSSGAALALSLSGGYNLQLNSTSKTYPDRLFFMGGVDSLRAFLSDSVVPQDDADRILFKQPVSGPGTRPTEIGDIAIRGGDIVLNPRIELRIPLNDTFHTGIFLDTGNLWRDPSQIDFTRLRYAAGLGLRISTPIGPLALDYGINMLRYDWEDFGALHFSIGLF